MRKDTKALRNHYFNIEAHKVLTCFSKALNEENIVFWLEFGTLLGYYRDHDFIKHDDDLDFGAYLNDAPKIRKALEAIGFKLIRYYTDNRGGIEECYRYMHTTLDIFYFNREAEGLHCTSYTRHGKSIWGSMLNRRACTVKQISIPDKGFIPVKYKDCYVNVPMDCVEHLSWHYGPSFMMPNPDFNYKVEARNIRYFSIDERKGILRIYGKKF